MRSDFIRSLTSHFQEHQNSVFLTADLGYLALETLRDQIGSRFFNMGIAESSMMGSAAGMAYKGLEPWTYSIAPFVYARPFEFIRNDICFHNLPVKIIGNGGGYGYGVMGPTHHAIEDYGVLSTLPNIKILIPSANCDLPDIVKEASAYLGPVYIRLSTNQPTVPSSWPTNFELYANVLLGNLSTTVLVVGPLVVPLSSSLQHYPIENRPSIWSVRSIPSSIEEIPPALIHQISNSSNLHIVEEHVQDSSFASKLALILSSSSIQIPAIKHHYAKSHQYPRYGSQSYLQKASSLSVEAIISSIYD